MEKNRKKNRIGKMLVAPMLVVGLGMAPLPAHAALMTAAEAELYTTAVLEADGTTVTEDSGSYTASAANESAIYAINSGTVTLTNPTISSSANYTSEMASGMWGVNSAVLADNGTIKITGGSITTSGTFGNAAFATNGGTVTISGTADDYFTIDASGAHAHGVDATNGGTVNLSYVKITTTGSSSSAVATDNVATDNISYVNVDNSILYVSGEKSAAAYVDATGVITITDSTLTSVNDCGAVVASAGVLSLTNCDVTGVTAIKMHCPNELYAGSATISDCSLTSTSTTEAAILYDTAIGNITVEDGTTITAASGILVDATDSTDASFTAKNVSLTGGIIADDTSALAVELDASTLTGYTSGAIALTMDSDSIWNISANSALSSLTVSDSTVNFINSGTYSTLTTTGDLTGSDTFNMNVDLKNALADLISVGGTASGTYQLYFTGQNTTSTLTSVVKVVDLSDTATNSATITGGADLGAYRYSVALGSTLSSSYSGLDSSDYYLYNTYTPSTPACAAIASSAESVVTSYGEMNEIKKRLGDLRLGAESGDLWARTYAAHYKATPVGGQTFYQTMKGIEVGKDNATSYNGGKKFAGFVIGGGTADNTFTSGGSGTTDSVYAGAYGSWIKDDGAYFDLIGKYNRLNHDFTSTLYGGGSDSASYHNNGFSLSAELGKHIERGDGVFVEPQAELSALWSGKSDYTSTNGLIIESLSSTSVQLRLGGMIGKKCTVKNGGTQEFYGKLSYVHEFDGDSQTVVNDATFDSSLKGDQVVAGIGYIADTGKQQLYIDIEKSWGIKTDGSSTNKLWGGNIGYRWKL
ncbi:MAG: hypothetical protein H6Q74_665 [Firmicutes bacterium]|nr:hypothetical protein [Bacillota bacterium]